MALLFWGCVAYVLYAYAGFPLLTILRGRLRPRPYRHAEIEPSVSLLVAAYNEVGVIEDRIRNALELDYPPERLEIVVASDGSDDGTNEIVRRYANGRVRLLELGRVGKAAALNAAVDAASGEVLVFSDANSIFRADAIRALVGPLADADVGGVAGNQVYLSPEAGDASVVGEQQYWNFDRSLKLAQSSAGSVTGATGAIYAIRRSLFQPIRADVNDDLLTSLRVIAQGYRLVFAPEAVAYEPVVESAAQTFSRRVRVMARGLRCVVVMRELLDPRRYGFFAFQLLSHKLLMRTTVIPLGILAVTSGLLWNHGLFYRVAAVGEAVFYLLGVVGILFADRSVAKWKPLALPAYFCLINAAAARAIWQLLSGEKHERWEPDRPAPTRPITPRSGRTRA
jgi:cellulose synthase/poly-beta-1,6-N-acetylglucosamine synthase-like glycosyltransferase